MPGRQQDTTAYILAGGFGTRLRQVVADRPKALAEILGRPYIYHLLDRLADCGLTRAVLCTGHMANMLEAALGGSYRGLTLRYSREDEPLGTGGALALALSRHPSPLALVINGDSLIEADLRSFMDWFARRPAGGDAGALLLAHVDEASRYGRVAVDCAGTVTGFVEKGQSGPGFISAGVYLLRPESLENVQPGRSASIEQDVFPALAAAGRLCALETRARFLDIGTPESYAEAGRFLLESGSQPSVRKDAAVFLDRDGTVIVQKHYMHDPDEVELLPGAVEGLRRMRALGLRLVLVTNQSGVGRGYFPSGDVERVHGRLIELLQAQGVRLDAIYTCPHAPEEACGCRKPLPGLIDRASKEIGLDPAQCYVIGDKPCDVDLGLAAGAAASLLVLTGYGEKHAAQLRARGDALVVADLAEAAAAIEKLRR